MKARARAQAALAGSSGPPPSRRLQAARDLAHARPPQRERKAEVLPLIGKTRRLLERSIGEARALARGLRAKAWGRGADAKLRAARQLDELARCSEKVAVQVRRRVKGEPISARIVSLHDTDARPSRKRKPEPAESATSSGSPS